MRTQVKVSLYRVVEWRDGAVFRTERLRDTWVEMMDGGKLPGRPDDSNLIFSAADTFDLRERDCEHNGLFADDSEYNVAHLCAHCDAWIANYQL